MAWASQQAQLDALQAARALVRSHHGEDIGHLAFIALARSLGSRNPQGRTLCCIIAVLDQLEHPGKFASDREAWEAHGAKQSNFKTWKGRIGHLISAELVDEVELSSQESATLSSALSEAEVRHTRGSSTSGTHLPTRCKALCCQTLSSRAWRHLDATARGDRAPVLPSAGTKVLDSSSLTTAVRNLFCHFSSIADGNMLQEGDTVQFVKRYDDRKGKDRAEDVIGGIAGDDRATNEVQSTMLPDPIVQGVAALGCNSQGRPSTGTALRWNEKGFGFIKPDDGGEDLFCHFSSITDGNMLREGDTVQFVKRYDDRKGKDRAEDVTGGIAGDDRATNEVQSTMLPDPIVQGVAALGCNSPGATGAPVLPSAGTKVLVHQA